jgi:hypothetical protein
VARKNVDPKAAKAARQKKIAIGGAVLLVAVLAFQVPRTLKMLHPSTPQSSAAPAATTLPTASTPAAPGVPVSNTPAIAPVLTARLAPAAREGQLSVLSTSFQSKDPFRQLIKADTTSSETTDATPKPAEASPTLKVVPSAKPATTEAKPAVPAATPAAPAVHKIVLPVLSAVISVNGVREGVNVKVDFPTDAPIFHLVSLTKKTAKISVAGGSLASGKATLTLRRGKPLTLVNTADGTRYRIVLLTTSTVAAATPPAQTTPAQTTTTPTQTTTTTPTTTAPTIGG